MKTNRFNGFRNGRETMLHSYLCVYIHCVWATLNRECILTREIRPQITNDIFVYAPSNSIPIDALNIQPNHVHCLIELKSNQNIDLLIKLLKGESSRWTNSPDLLRYKFSRQRGYGAFSVGYRQLSLMRNNIARQDGHYRRRSFTEEIDNLLLMAGIRETGFEPPSPSFSGIL